MKSSLTLTSFDAVPEHMEQLGGIARTIGLTRSALLRLMIARYVRRAAKQAASDAALAQAAQPARRSRAAKKQN